MRIINTEAMRCAFSGTYTLAGPVEANQTTSLESHQWCTWRLVLPAMHA